MFNLILFGPPGSGKGTQSDKLIHHFGLLHISTGDLLRDEVKRETALGLEAKSFMDQGQLVPDAVVIGMIDSKINDNLEAKGIIFDGFPRTVEQAKALDALLELKEHSIDSLLWLEVPEDELIKRLLQRGLEAGRSDDTREIIEKRIKEYTEKTKPVADYYKIRGKMTKIKGTGTVEDIFGRIKKAVASFIEVE